MTTTAPSPFLSRSTTSSLNSLSLLHLRRDSSLPVVLSNASSTEYAEGPVINTRFGSYPHSTLVDVPWGSQVRASKVNIGLKGRPAQTKKRKREAGDDDVATPAEDGDLAETGFASAGVAGAPPKEAITASSGFAHLLPPTPETWTLSLPHRTQVVYTPDYSYILQRLKVRPGSVLIEAGAGSGSFTHAAARAVYDGAEGKGHVYSFEYHAVRASKMQDEILAHGLADTVTLTHRDVYDQGFHLKDKSVKANAVFLDLPAPWLALPHLTRSTSSPLDPSSPVHICCFLPCIEQVQRTMTLLRDTFVQVEMISLSSSRIEVRRERIGVNEQGLKGANTSPIDIDEALRHLKDVEKRTELFHKSSASEDPKVKDAAHEKKMQSLQEMKQWQRERKAWSEGMVTSRTEPEVKGHTSYLVFAVLPVSWSEEDEMRERERWGGGVRVLDAKKGKKGGGKGAKVKVEDRASDVGIVEREVAVKAEQL